MIRVLVHDGAAQQRVAKRWDPLRPHAEQFRLWTSKARFRVVPAGRRSGKTELAKRWVIERALSTARIGRKYVFAAPTRDQAKRIYWADLKRMVPPAWVNETRHTELELLLVTGTRLCVVGMDRPERIEGEPLDGIILDEFANMRPTAWAENVSPALDTPGRQPGWAWFIGVPEGRNHYFDLWSAVPEQQARGGSWDRFTWHSSDIMSAEAIADARRRLDERTFRQEYEGSFESWAGLAYYAWSDAGIVRGLSTIYDTDADLIMCFDFNVQPGVALVSQDVSPSAIRRLKPDAMVPDGDTVTAVLGEVWIPQHSNTPMVCERLLADWRYHRGKVCCYGDATGGARTSSSVAGSNWDIIESILRPVFGSRLRMRQRHGNPSERARVNAVNSRLAATDGRRRLFVDPAEAPHVVRDFERVETVRGGGGELLKESGSELTHLSDAIGYYIAERFPLRSDHIVETVVA